MKNQNTAIMDDQEKCGASVAETFALIKSLTYEERERMLQLLLERYGMKVPRNILGLKD